MQVIAHLGMEFDLDGEQRGELLLELPDRLASRGVVDAGDRIVAAEPGASDTSPPGMIDGDDIRIYDRASSRGRHRNTPSYEYGLNVQR